MTECTECGAKLALPEDVMYGEVIDCTQCGVELVVENVKDLALKKVDCSDEDWGE